MTNQELIAAAASAKKNAYANFSHFRVRAALIAESRRIYTGANIELAIMGISSCAERVAVYKAVSEGERKVKRIAIVSDYDGIIYPCGVCRQMLSEFGGQEVIVVCANINGDYEEHSLEKLLPNMYVYEEVKK